MSNPLIELKKFGQSVWLDYISRGILNNNELKQLVENDGITGVTSNPSIFQKAMADTNDYDEQIISLLSANSNLSAEELFEDLAVKDIQDAADVLLSVYKNTNGTDGYVSLEVSPELAYDTQGTIEEARRLYGKVGRENVLIKIPATQEGLPAIEQMIYEGVNINVTLIFSPLVYEQVVDAYLKGLERRTKEGKSIGSISSVASFFISRIDTAVDKELEKIENKDLRGKIAIANARLVYKNSERIFSDERFKNLENKGAKIQRLLWASTSTKNPAYPDTLYVTELVGKNTVNTIPPATMEAFKDHGKVSDAIHKNLTEAGEQMKALAAHSIDFETITEKLTAEGVDLFVQSFRKLISAIEVKKDKMTSKLITDVTQKIIR